RFGLFKRQPGFRTVAGSLLRNHKAFQLAESNFDQCFLLRVMLVVITNSRRSAGWTPRITELLPFTHVLQNIMLNLEPGSLILRLILSPYQFGEIRELAQFRRKGLVRERIELLDTNDGHIVLLTFTTGCQQVVIHTSRAGDDTFDLFRINRLVNLTDHRLECAFGKFTQWRTGLFVTQQGLRCQDHQWFAELAYHLAPQQMEDLRGSSRLRHLHIIVGTKLQEALGTCR